MVPQNGLCGFSASEKGRYSIAMEKLSIIIPAYNEAPTLQQLVEKILKVSFPVPYEIILVDDHSRDRTYEIARLLNQQDTMGRIHVLRNEVNRGKGYSILRGLEQAQGDVIVVQDADFEYDPRGASTSFGSSSQRFGGGSLREPLSRQSPSSRDGSRELYGQSLSDLAHQSSF